jgi:pilus assembly protein CpaB
MRPTPPVRRPATWLPRLPLALTLRRRPRLRRALVVGLAVVVAAGVTATVRRAEAARDAWGRSRAVVVAARDLPVGHALERGDTTVRTLPEAAVPEGALARVAEGRGVHSPVLEGEVLLRRRLAEPDVGGVAAVLPEGSRAVAIPADASAVPPLEVGQRVDVLAVGATDGRAVAAALATDALVVHVGEHAVTLAVDPGAVPRIAAALAAGAVTLALVAPGEAPAT